MRAEGFEKKAAQRVALHCFSCFFRPVTEPQRTQSGLAHGLMGVEKKCSERSAAGVLETPWSPMAMAIGLQL